MGVYKPTILPRMPAALTVVPAPSSTRPCHVTEPREVKIELSKMHSIHIPAVPTVSPVPNIDIATASSCSTEDGSSAELFSVAMKKSEETHSFESSRVEEFSGEKTPLPEEVCVIFRHH
jgi:adenylyl- and sulfurtransferase ThiI